jgi:hypothetical protein
VTMGGLHFPKEPPPPGGWHGRYALLVVVFILLTTFICVADRLDLFR